MGIKKITTFHIVVLFVLLVAGFSLIDHDTQSMIAHGYADSADSSAAKVPATIAKQAVYIVQLQDDPLATYQGNINNLAATSPSTLGLSKLDINSLASSAYLNYLAAEQAQFLLSAENNLNREIEAIYQYDVVYNGVALPLTPEEALTIAKIPGVVNVQRDTWQQKLTDVTPAFIGAENIWNGSAVKGPGTKGEGIIVGVIDTGIWPEHPSFADDGSYPAPVGWNGDCSVPSDGSQPYTCNNKLIGAKYFLSGYSVASGGYDGLFKSARDDDGHGTHTASTAAGNEGIAVTLLGENRGVISGIAPRAYVAAYKGLGPAGGVSSDLVAAINAAVKDGVDVINYSIGSGASDPWTDASSLAFRAARAAGVFVATSAGNSGPDASTIGSPGNAPWITTVGASTSNRHFISDITLKGPDTPPTGLFGASVTSGVKNFNLVDAEGIADSIGDSSGLCLNPFPAGTFTTNDVVLCQRGKIDRVLRGTYVKAGGGGGVILYNPEQQGLATDNYEIPAVHVENDVGLLIKDYIDAHPGEVTVSFTKGQKIFDSDPRVMSDMMASFSSRGPNATLLDVIKPDVTAPGVQILAGASPQHDGSGAQGELFQAIQGTSMSSPHVAGAAALVKAVNPDWSPAEIESALMTTSNSSQVKEDGKTNADPFDMGAGRIDLNNAALASLVLDETVANYIAANPNSGGDPKTLNIASLGNSNCVNFCSWNRTLRNTTDETLSWDASVQGLNGTVTPSNFSLKPDEEITLSIVVSANGLTVGDWAFGMVEINPNTAGRSLIDKPSTHLPIAIIPDENIETKMVRIETRRDAGSTLIQDLLATEITEMTIEAYGLVPGESSDILLAKDPTGDDPFDNLGQVWWMITPVSSGASRLVNEIRASEAKDVDLYVGFDSNGNMKPDADEEVCSSKTSSWNEYCNVEQPQEGKWWVLVQNWAGTGVEMKDSILLATAVVGNQNEDNMLIDAPITVPAQQPFDVRVEYDLMDTFKGQSWYGAFTLGTDSENLANVAKFAINLYRIEDDVVKQADVSAASPGDKIAYIISVVPNEHDGEVSYQIVDLIPDGLSYVEGSAQASAGSVTVIGSELTWSGVLNSANLLQPLGINSVRNKAEPVTINYQAVVDNDAPFGGYLFNRADSTTSAVGSKKETAVAPIFIGYRSFFPISLSGTVLK